jgi:hypothetical protein
MISFGGAAGNCPPVRKVTCYSSTSIVRLGLTTLKPKGLTKTVLSSRGKVSLAYAAARRRGK